ncbi:MAG: hypothetical protein ACLS9K_10530 [Lachnospira eligens]
MPTIKRWIQRQVAYAGSFSKVMAPDPLGFLVFNKSPTGPHSCKAMHRCTFNCPFQYICNEYGYNYDFDNDLEDSRKVYEHKCNLMMECTKKYSSFSNLRSP